MCVHSEVNCGLSTGRLMFSPASHPSTVNSARKCSQIIARGLQGAAGTMESSSSLQIETQQG